MTQTPNKQTPSECKYYDYCALGQYLSAKADVCLVGECCPDYEPKEKKDDARADKVKKAEIKARREFEKCLCPKCAHFRAVYPIWGAYTECDRSGEWQEQDWTRKECKSYEPK